MSVTTCLFGLPARQRGTEFMEFTGVAREQRGENAPAGHLPVDYGLVSSIGRWCLPFQPVTLANFKLPDLSL